MSAYSNYVIGTIAPDWYLRLGESVGTNAVDATGNGKNGTYGSSGITYGKESSLTGDSDTSVELSGVTVQARVDVPYTVGNVQTIAGRAWRKDSGSEDAIFGSTSASKSCWLRLREGNQNVAFAANGADSVTWAAAWPGNEQWVSWAVKFDLGAANTVELLLNGVSQGVKEVTANLETPGTFQLGITATAGFAFKGRLDECWAKASLISNASLLTLHEIAGTGIGPSSGTPSFPLSRRNRIVNP